MRTVPFSVSSSFDSLVMRLKAERKMAVKKSISHTISTTSLLFHS